MRPVEATDTENASKQPLVSCQSCVTACPARLALSNDPFRCLRQTPASPFPFHSVCAGTRFRPPRSPRSHEPLRTKAAASRPTSEGVSIRIFASASLSALFAGRVFAFAPRPRTRLFSKILLDLAGMFLCTDNS